jgi:hypothetical protein
MASMRPKGQKPHLLEKNMSTFLILNTDGMHGLVLKKEGKIDMLKEFGEIDEMVNTKGAF